MTPCAHPNFLATVKVARLEDSGAFFCEVLVKCAECQEPFRFKGIQAGLNFDRPMVSVDGLELRAPIEPEGEQRLYDAAAYHMPMTSTRH